MKRKMITEILELMSKTERAFNDFVDEYGNPMETVFVSIVNNLNTTMKKYSEIVFCEVEKAAREQFIPIELNNIFVFLVNIEKECEKKISIGNEKCSTCGEYDDDFMCVLDFCLIKNEYLKYFKYYLIEPQKEAKIQPQPLQIPITPAILNELQKQGFIENTTAQPLKWLKSKSLLAYFVDAANDKLHLKHGEKRQIKPFETLFNETGITNAINDYKKTGQSPIGYEKIDNILK